MSYGVYCDSLLRHDLCCYYRDTLSNSKGINHKKELERYVSYDSTSLMDSTLQPPVAPLVLCLNDMKLNFGKVNTNKKLKIKRNMCCGRDMIPFSYNNEPQFKFLCVVCGKKFIYESYLLKHATRLYEPRRYDCQQCGESFSSLKDLRGHKKINGCKAKMSKCKLCKKQLTCGVPFKVHMLRHSGQKNFFCPVCKKGFVIRSELKYHMSRFCAKLTHFS